MIPIYLSIEGLFSYQEKQTIDFEALTTTGLFGIFGSVGSGKSSIIEAISFVLYETSERLDSKDKRTYNMLNLKSNNAYIDYQFYNFENKKYKYTASWKRKKKFHEVESLVRSAYIWENEQWIPLPSNDATAIIGLSYDNFKRTVIIPQGKFKEFLELKGKDRSTMMKDLFGLHQFDLSFKVSVLSSKTTAALNEEKGKLSQFEHIHPELVPEQKNLIAELSKDIEIQKTKYAFLEKEIKATAQLLQQQQDYDNALQAYNLLASQISDFDIKQTQLLHYEQAVSIFQASFYQASQLADSLQDTQAQLLIAQQELTKATLQQQSIQNAIDKISDAFSSLDTTTLIVGAFNHLIALRTHENNLTIAEQKKEKGAAIIKNLEENIQSTQSQIERKDTLVKNLITQQLSTQERIALSKWYQDYAIITQNITQVETNILHIDDEIEKAKKQLHFEENPSWEDALSNKLTATKAEIENIKKDITTAALHQKLATFTQQIQEGTPCPLCGALDHPSILQLTNSDDLMHLQNKLQAKEKSILQLQAHQQQLILVSNNILALSEKKSVHNKEQRMLHEQKHLLEKEYRWKDLQIANTQQLEAFNLKQNALEIEIRNEENLIKQYREQAVSEEANLKKYNVRIQELDINIAELRQIIVNEKQQLVGLDINQYLDATTDTLLEEQLRLQHFVKTTKDNYKSLQESLQQSAIQTNTFQNKVSILVQQQKKLEHDYEIIQQKINNDLLQGNFESVNTIRKILAQNINIIEERNIIQAFQVNIKLAQAKLATLEQVKLSTQKIDIAQYEQQQKELVIQKEVLDITINELAIRNNNLEILEQQLIKKQLIAQQFDALQSRSQNLQVLKNLFNGAGFVNYISTIYLRNLCDVANLRFHRLTKNQLSLTINENNDFEVIDYLNNGYRRSVKTLSGGQFFQASLSLALALAESVKSMHVATKNFFFIDEGFGALDNDALELVFETLQNLHKENRIVGIISHVEALQEKLPQYIKVSKDEAMGSQINIG